MGTNDKKEVLTKESTEIGENDEKIYRCHSHVSDHM